MTYSNQSMIIFLLIPKFANYLIRPTNRNFGLTNANKLVGVRTDVLYIHHATPINAYK